MNAGPVSVAEQATRAYLDGLERWALARSGMPEVARTLRLLAAAAQDGQLGLPLGEASLLVGKDESIDLAALVRSGWLTDAPAASAAPMALDRQRLYLWRHQRAEARVAAQLLLRARPRQGQGLRPVGPDMSGRSRHDQHPAPAVDPGDPAPTISTGADADQRAAVAAAGQARLQVITGGPGTGKTSTVLQLLLALLAGDGSPAPLRIGLAAPTGKAAQRLAAALLQGKRELGQTLPAALHAQLALLPESATTLHTLLAFLPGEDRFRHDAGDPLALDVLVVDEASMVDLELMDALLDALPEQALLVLLGDPDQLVSVAHGTVLADLVSAADASPIIAAVVHRLRHVWRASGALVDLPAAIRSGHWPQVQQVLQAAPAVIAWQPAGDAATLGRLQQQWLQASTDDYAALARPGLAAQDALEQLGRRQVLCAVRDGPFGMLALNAAIAARVRHAAGVAAGTPWYRGRVVMLTHNQHALKLYNGDVGVTLEDADGNLQVWFAGADAPRRFLPRQLSDHEDAWAITVHKSQGSEYDEVLLVLPPDPEHRLLSRELLYTGVTRAKKRLQLWAAADALQAAVARPVQRSGGLRERLASA